MLKFWLVNGGIGEIDFLCVADHTDHHMERGEEGH